MIDVLLILFCIALYTGQNLFFKLYGDKYPGDPRYVSFVYVTFSGIVAAAVSFFASGMSFEFDPLTVALGITNACVYFTYYIAMYNAASYGPYSGVMIFTVVGGISLPIITSLIAFHDVPSIWKVICLIVIFFAGYLVNKRDDEDTSIKNKKKFFAYGFLLAFVNGAYGSLINLQQAYTGDTQKDEMLIYTFGLGSLLSFIYVAIKNKSKTPATLKQTRLSLLFMILAATVAATAINILVVIAKVIDINLLWTFCNSGVIVLSVILSAIIFKERLSRTNITGCIIIAIALVLISYT